MSFSHSLVINNCEVKFSTNENKIFCTSLDVARVFGKRHDDVLKGIRNILNDLQEIGDLQCERNFTESFQYRKIKGFRGGGKKYLYYNLARDGFSLLTMGFTGKRALQWKIAFIDAFNEMEKLLQKEIYSPDQYLTDLMKQIYPNLPQNDYQINVVITNNPYSKDAKDIFSLNYIVDNRTPKDPKNFNLSFQTRKIK